MTLDQLLADWRGDAAVLRRNGEVGKADLLERCATDAARAAEPWLTWLSEADAMLRSGRSREWLRGRFAAWEREGHARSHGKLRQYRMAIVPQRAQVATAAEAGRAAARRLLDQRRAS